MTVHIDLTFAPLLKVKECIARLFQVEITAIVADVLLRKTHRGEAVSLIQFVECTSCVLITIGNRHNGPVLEVISCLVPVNLSINGHAFGNAFEILNGPSEVDTAHGFDEYREVLALFYGWKH